MTTTIQLNQLAEEIHIIAVLTANYQPHKSTVKLKIIRVSASIELKKKMNKEIKLPTLPAFGEMASKYGIECWTKDQLQQYAIQAVQADRAIEPYAWHYWTIAGTSVFYKANITSKESLENAMKAAEDYPEAHFIVPLYTIPVDMNTSHRPKLKIPQPKR